MSNTSQLGPSAAPVDPSPQDHVDAESRVPPHSPPRPRRVRASDKILDHHLDRRAVVYVRQSSQHQVLEHRESAARQYGLTERAKELGWARDQIDVIDDDQGISGSSIAGREGFQKLLAEISAGRVGIVLGLEMSRLARSCKDWHTLLELCAIYQTLLADADGLYDPSNYNDRLLLGLKGTMSEAELHILKARMHEALWNKAGRGEVLNHPPIGYLRSVKARDGAGDYVIDPDAQVQAVVRLVFEQFERLGSINALLRWMVKHEIKLPIRPHFGHDRGDLQWRRPNRATLNNLHRLGDVRANPAKTAGKQPFEPGDVRAASWPERAGWAGGLRRAPTEGWSAATGCWSVTRTFAKIIRQDHCVTVVCVKRSTTAASCVRVSPAKFSKRS